MTGSTTSAPLASGRGPSPLPALPARPARRGPRRLLRPGPALSGPFLVRGPCFSRSCPWPALCPTLLLFPLSRRWLVGREGEEEWGGPKRGTAPRAREPSPARDRPGTGMGGARERGGAWQGHQVTIGGVRPQEARSAAA